MSNLPEYEPLAGIHHSALSGLIVALSFTIGELDPRHTSPSPIQFLDRLDGWLEQVLNDPTTLLENDQLLQAVVARLRQVIVENYSDS